MQRGAERTQAAAGTVVVPKQDGRGHTRQHEADDCGAERPEEHRDCRGHRHNPSVMTVPAPSITVRTAPEPAAYMMALTSVPYSFCPAALGWKLDSWWIRLISLIQAPTSQAA